MKKETLQLKLSTAKENLKKLEATYEMTKLCIEKCNNILTIGIYNLSLNERNEVILANELLPCQFSEKATKIILETAKFTDSKGEPSKQPIIVYTATDYYKKEIDEQKNTINQLTQMLQKKN